LYPEQSNSQQLIHEKGAKTITDIFPCENLSVRDYDSHSIQKRRQPEATVRHCYTLMRELSFFLFFALKVKYLYFKIK